MSPLARAQIAPSTCVVTGPTTRRGSIRQPHRPRSHRGRGSTRHEWRQRLPGGVEQGGGYGILPGGRPVRPPHEWRRLSPAEQDMADGLAVRNLSPLLDNPSLPGSSSGPAMRVVKARPRTSADSDRVRMPTAVA